MSEVLGEGGKKTPRTKGGEVVRSREGQREMVEGWDEGGGRWWRQHRGRHGCASQRSIFRCRRS